MPYLLLEDGGRFLFGDPIPFGPGYTTVTLTEFIANVRERLGPTPFWTDNEIRNFTNSALRTWNCLTGFWSGGEALVTVGDHPYYPLQGTLVFGARVELDGVALDTGTVFGWDQQDPHWMSYRGTPQMWAPVGIGIVALNPIPAGGGQSLVVYGTAVTPILVNAGDTINIGREDFNALKDYIVHTLQVKSGGAEFQSSKSGYQAFIKAAGVRNEKLRASIFYRRVMGLEQDKTLKRMRAAVNAVVKEAANPVGMR